MTTITAPAPAALPRPKGRRFGSRSWVDFFLLTFMLTNMAWAMHAARWAPGLDRLYLVVLIASIAGSAVALGGFGRLFATLYSLVVGGAAILLSLSALAPTGLENQDRAFFVINRAYIWALNALTDAPLPDNLVFVLWLAALVWVLGYSAVWTYFRERRKWQAVLPTGLAMLVNLYYAPPRLNAYFVVYLLCAILLLVRATLAEREVEWQRARVRFPLDISFDFMRDGVLFALFVIFVSWILPSAASGGQLNPVLEPLRQPWEQFQQEWERLFSTVSYGRVVGVPTFGTTLSLGGPRDVTDELVMDVDTPVNRYFRAVVHDTYLPDGGGWSLRQAEGVRLSDENEFELAAWQEREVITQTVTTYQGNNVLIAAPQPIRALIPTDAYIVAAQDEAPGEEEQQSQRVELAMLVSHNDLDEGDSYVVVSSIVAATVAQLQADGAEYPDYIGERYLQLPDSVPQRVFDRAEELAGELDNPYEIAKAIERYLRGYTYNDQIPGPAPGQDGVDYFLFEEQQGYCNYYASAMAVMLRHLGIPTRLASGYATGEFQPETGLYRLRNNDLHTWVEVFFPSYGWVEFEPTASEPVLIRPSGSTAEREGDVAGAGPGNPDDGLLENSLLEQQELGTDTGEQSGVPSLLNSNSGFILLLLSLAGILFIGLWSARRMRMPVEQRAPTFHTVPQGFAARLWDKLMNWARRFHVIEDPSLTPLEQAGAFGINVPQARDGARAIADLYTRDLYSPHPITPEDASQAQISWMILRPILWRSWLDRNLRLPAGLKRALFRGD